MQIASSFSQRNKKETVCRKLFIEGKLTTPLQGYLILYLHSEIAHSFVHLVQNCIVHNIQIKKNLITKSFWWNWKEN